MQTVVDVVSLVRHCVERVTRGVVPSNVRVAIESEHPQWIIADRSELEQILFSLLVPSRNAIGHNAAIVVSVDAVDLTESLVHAVSTRAPGVWARLCVMANEPGTPPASLPEAPDPVFTTECVGTGAWLDLAMIRETVRRWGGHVEVETASRSGTTISCYFPAVVPAETAVAGARHDQVRHRLNARILVVDDDPAVLRMTERQLKRSGYIVRTAKHGRDALAVIDMGWLPDVVLTDVMMPEMNGRALSEILSDRFPNLPVVFMSGGVAGDLLKENWLQTRERLLRKPFTLFQLLTILERGLAGA